MRRIALLWPGSPMWTTWTRTQREACQVAICLVFLFHLVRSNADSLPISPDSTNDPRCLKDCSNARQKPLCGSDDRTYSSSCELKRVKACLGRKTKVKHKGPCVAEVSKCEIEKASAQEQMDSANSNVYVPQCNEDGSYSSVQCHFSFGWCWCVNDEGKPLPRTAVRHQRPSCDAEPVVDVVRPDINLVPTPAKPAKGEEDAPADSTSSREAGLPSVLVTRQVPHQEQGTVVLSCTVELQRATAEAARDSGVFIPQCNDDGSYMPVQCHEEAEYCWCSFVDTGRPIPGTSGRMPFKADCDPTATFRTPVARREFKDCPDSNKARFLLKLMDAIRLSMNDVDAQPDRLGQPTEESVQIIHTVLWEFYEVDINRNGILEPPELEIFSEFVNTVRASKRCRRNFLSYCDSNEDDNVSQREWLQCFEVDGADTIPIAPSRGRNPFIDRLT